MGISIEYGYKPNFHGLRLIFPVLSPTYLGERRNFSGNRHKDSAYLP